MGWHNVRLDLADRLFSQYIRLRDGECIICGKKGTGPDKIHGLQASHFHSRRKESVRYDPENVDTLCPGCHKRVGEYRKEYKEFKKQQLGKRAYDLLDIRANTYKKKDRKLEILIARELLKTLKRT